MNEPIAPAVIAHCDRLRRLPTATVSDVLAAMGLDDRIVSWTLRPLGAPVPFAGPAVCFAGEDDDSSTPPSAAKLAYETDRRIVPGCVAVIATRAHRVGAVIGGNSIASWRRHELAALVTDGLVRDAGDFDGLPTICAGHTPMNNRGRWSYRTLDREVELPGQTGRPVIVRPGDIVHGDRDGVLVVPAEHLPRLVHDVEITDAIERRMREQIDAGVDRQVVYETNPRFAHVRRVVS